MAIKKLLWFLLLLLILLLLLLWLWRVAGCGKKPAPGTADLVLDVVTHSVWPDGTLALALPIKNEGTRAAGSVTVTSVSLASAALLSPSSLPVPLGEIVSDNRAVLQTHFAALAVPGSYTLSVSGTYKEGAANHSFSFTAPIVLAAPATGPVTGVTSTIPIQKTPGIPTKPSPIPAENGENNLVGPPVPLGPVLHPFPVAPNQTGPVKAPSSGSGMSITFIRDTGSAQPTGVPPDPSTAVSSTSGVVLATANTYLLFSIDDGQTFTREDPTTIFPQSDGGLCCDQVILYDRNVDLFFWLMQYWSAPPPAGSPKGTPNGPNRLRIAFAHPADLKTNFNLWSYFDLTQGTFNSAGSLDYPDIAFTNTFLYASVDGQDSKGSNTGLIVARMPLSDITGSSGSVGISYVGPAQSTDLDRAFASRLTQSSADAMYWSGHVDTSHLEVFHWADSSGSVDLHTTKTNSYCNTDYTTLAPDNQQWLDNLRAAGTGAIIASTRKTSSNAKSHGEVWMGWTAARDDSSCKDSRPQPYVKIVRIDDTTLDSVGEYHIWNTPYAFAYPSLGTAPNGDIGVAVSFGGPSNYGSTTVGYLGDYVVYYVEQSDVTLTFQLTNPDGTGKVDANGNPVLGTRWGDMFAVRNSGRDNTFLSSLGYAYKFVDSTKSTKCSTPPGCTYRVHYEQWSR